MKMYLLLILGLLFISGCVAQQGKNPDNGIVINEFSADPKVVEYGDTVRFFLDGENLGGTTAECVTTELYGLEGGWTKIDGTLFKPALANNNFGIRIDFNKGLRGIFLSWINRRTNTRVEVGYKKDSGVSLNVGFGGIFTDFTTQFCDRIAQVDPDIRFEPFLSPPLPERNKPGQSFTADWILQPPRIPEGLKVDYPVTARTSFFYTSNAQVNIQAFSKAEFKRRQDIGENTAYPLNVINTHSAPLKVSIQRGASPIIVNTDTLLTDVETFNYLIEIRNAGNGFPLPFENIESTGGTGDPITESGFMIATMTINGPGARFEDCLSQQGSEIIIGPDIAQNLIKLRSDGRAPFGCKIVVDKRTWQNIPVGTISLTFRIFYRYYIDKHAVVTVIGPSSS